MSANVIEGYSTFYNDKHGTPLPQETVDKIMLLYHNRIERHCINAGLTMEGEEDANFDVDDLSESGKESKEHDLDEVNFYSDVDENGDDNDNDDDDNNDSIGKKGNGDNDDEGMDNASKVAKWEHEVKALRANLESNFMVILQRMTNSPNWKNPYRTPRSMSGLLGRRMMSIRI